MVDYLMNRYAAHQVVITRWRQYTLQHTVAVHMDIRV